MRFEVLGGLRLQGDAPIAVSRPSHRRLLEILLLDPGRRISSDVLIDRFWRGEPPATAKAALHTHISALRKLVGADRIATDDSGYQLLVEGGEVDAIAFRDAGRSAVAMASTGDPGAVLAAADEALSLWQGAPFGELRDDDFALPTIVSLEELRLELLEIRADALLALDRAAEVLPDLEALVMEHPLRERLWEHLMMARFRLGRIPEALHAYRQASDHLAEMGLEPGERLRRLEERVLLEDVELRLPPHNLPEELDEFVGRAREVDDTMGLLQSERLVTITGAGGSGKTRLALHVAREQLEVHTDGVWLVELAPTRDPAHVATAVARAMGLRPRDDDVLGFIERATASADLLVVLDNCEHVVESAAAVVEHLLRASSRLRILATSREPLRARGETVYELEGLAVPTLGERSPAAARETEAVRLYEARARRSRPTYEIREEDVAAVAAICRRLDGLPLAIELAAARSRSMTPADISDRLDDHLTLLTGGVATGPERHHTLEATIDWSYRLLDTAQRDTLNRLSVFRGGFDLAAAELVAAGAGSDATRVAPVVADLADRSLVVVQDSTQGRRYRLLETVRQFAEARFRETTHAMTTYARHRDWCLGLVEDLWERALDERRRDLSTMLVTEADNLQAALDWCRTAGDERSRSVLAQALGWHWYLAGHLATAATRLREALETEATPRESALTRSLLARCLTFAEDLRAARDVAGDAVARIDLLDQAYERVWVIESEHNIHWMALDADPGAMLRLAALAGDSASSSTDNRTRTLVERLAADAHCWNGHTEEGLRHQRIAIDAARATGDPVTINETYGASLYNYMLDGDARRTEPLAVVREWEGLGTLDGDAWRTRATDWLPWVFMQSGELNRAEDAITRIGDRTLEGYNRTIYFIARGSLAWMRGDIGSAAAELTEVGAGGIHRWAHCYYPLLAELAADRGSLVDAQRVAEEYLSLPVHPSREAPKLGVLYPVVRTAVDLALSTGSSTHEAAAAQTVAEQAFAQMRTILETSPPLVRGWTSILTHEQNLALAEAELTRLGSPSPSLWESLAGTLDYHYYELYARWRLGEALVASGAVEAGGETLVAVLAGAAEAGMHGIAGKTALTATAAGLAVADGE